MARASTAVSVAPAPASRPTQLRQLKDTLTAIDQDVRAIQKPIHDVKSVIADLKAPLALPGKIDKRLKDLITVLEVLKAVSSILALAPAPIGPAARGAKEGIQVLIGPPGKGSIGAMRAIIADIDKLLKKPRDMVEKLEKPVNKAAAAIDGVESRIAFLMAMTDRLIAHYGDSPPADVEACAKALNDPLSKFAKAVDQAKKDMVDRLGPLLAVLNSLKTALAPLGEVARRIEQAMRVFESKAFRNALRAAGKVANAIEGVVKKVGKITQWVFNWILKKLGIDPKSIEAFLNKILGALDFMKPIERMLKNLLEPLKGLIGKLPDVTKLIKRLLGIEDLQDKIEDAVAKFLASKCRKILLPDSLPGEPA